MTLLSEIPSTTSSHGCARIKVGTRDLDLDSRLGEKSNKVSRHEDVKDLGCTHYVNYENQSFLSATYSFFILGLRVISCNKYS